MGAHDILSFEQFMDLALYDPTAGYYQSNVAQSRRQGDYITSVEVGPLFGAVISRALDSWWIEMGRPKPFYVLDIGAGVGTLGRTILHAKPQCMEALRYVLVEQSGYLASQHTDLLERKDVWVRSYLVDKGGGINLPFDSVEFGVVIANELLDNMAIALLEKTTNQKLANQKRTSQKIGGWMEVGVELDKPETLDQPKNKIKENKAKEKAGLDAVSEKLIPADPVYVELANQLAPDAQPGQRIPIQAQSRIWLENILGILKQGRVLVFDYGVLDTSHLANRPQSEWLRTYMGQNYGSSPYQNVGRQDITCEVAIDQLAKVQEPALVQTQREFLNYWGIQDLVEEAMRSQNMHGSKIPTDLKSIELYSRISEAEALCDPHGLGAHLAAEWAVG